MKDKKFINRVSFWMSVVSLTVAVFALFKAQTALVRIDAHDELLDRNSGSINVLSRRSVTPSSSNDGGNRSTSNP